MQRRSLFKLHNAIGLVAALFVLLSALTGAVLLFRESLSFVPPEAPVIAEHVPLEAIVAAAEREGGAPVTDLGLPQTPEQPYHAWLDDDAETELWLDGSGAVLARHEGKSGLTRWLFRLHTGELLGVFGQILMVALALGLCLLAWSGVSMWWSRRPGRRGRAAR
ncbi:PepSY domain-containing protein [Nannocystaceae bacterium ST9]